MYTLYSLVISATWDGFDEVQELSMNVILDIWSFRSSGGVNNTASYRKRDRKLEKVRGDLIFGLKYQ